jgi:hypothetical protein
MTANETRQGQGGHGHEALAVLAMLPARGTTAMAWLVALLALLAGTNWLGR